MKSKTRVLSRGFLRTVNSKELSLPLNVVNNVLTGRPRLSDCICAGWPLFGYRLHRTPCLHFRLFELVMDSHPSPTTTPTDKESPPLHGSVKLVSYVLHWFQKFFNSFYDFCVVSSHLNSWYLDKYSDTIVPNDQ